MGWYGRDQCRPGRVGDERSLRDGFTIVELLVVIVIMAVGVALILGGLGYSREVARRTACSTNLWQNGVVTATYVQDHRSFPSLGYVTSYDTNDNLIISLQPSWAGLTGLSLYKEEALRCPSDPTPATIPYYKTNRITNPPDSLDMSYGYNLELFAHGGSPGSQGLSGLVIFYDGTMTDPSGPTQDTPYAGVSALVPGTFAKRHIKQMNLLHMDGSVRAADAAPINDFVPGLGSNGGSNGMATAGNNGNSNANGNANANANGNSNANANANANANVNANANAYVNFNGNGGGSSNGNGNSP